MFESYSVIFRFTSTLLLYICSYTILHIYDDDDNDDDGFRIYKALYVHSMQQEMPEILSPKPEAM
jgi:hypothetical protein